jgi:hypothetical protein
VISGEAANTNFNAINRRRADNTMANNNTAHYINNIKKQKMALLKHIHSVPTENVRYIISVKIQYFELIGSVLRLVILIKQKYREI